MAQLFSLLSQSNTGKIGRYSLNCNYLVYKLTVNMTQSNNWSGFDCFYKL